MSRAITQKGFTFIELLVVIAIISILIAVLLPSISAIRGKAKNAEANAQFLALATGLEAFRGEQALGNAFPPSSSDNTLNATADRKKIADPFDNAAAANTPVDGAHLLVHALVGFDLLGPPGFKDRNKDGYWANDTHQKVDPVSDKNGLYAVTNGIPVQARYGGPGNSFVDEKMRSRVESLAALETKGRLAGIGQEERTALGNSIRLPVFLDPWDRPILYYRANSSAQRMVWSSTENSPTPGVFRVDDNSLIAGLGNQQGIDFGAGPDVVTGQVHGLSVALYPDHDDDLTSAKFAGTLAAFIRDPEVRVNTPVRKDTYLLISAGPDARYGTADDITNWSREGQ